MSTLKFDVLDMIREPDNYTSGERAKGAEATAELVEAAAEMNRLAKGPPSGVSTAEKRAIVARMDAALARFGGAE